ncbi:baseplate J/gp47 family protein, partial [Propionibacterium freudenreichii]|uniref:baseplate J/gp47 family protein n=1 Tax=Propionibacterium freudenreichii TaxID=1744 RepID=UPI003852F0B8
RIAATAAASGSTVQIGALVVRYGSGATQVLYSNTEPFTPVPGSTVDVVVAAQVAGSSGNVGNNATLALVTAYPGLSVTNPVIGSTGTW